MKKIIASIFLTLLGWKFKQNIDITKAKKAVLVAAPHTSNWDFPIAIATMWKMNVDIKFLIKDDYTKSWYGGLFKKMGAIGVNRSNLKGNNLIEYTANLLKEKEFILMIPAEGTRERTDQWKKGFYYIAKKANLPVILAYLDYEKKEAGMGKLMHPKGKTMEFFFKETEDFFKNIKAKFPEKYNPNIY